MRPLHRGPDGTYQLRIEMRPPELGRVDLRVEMKDGVLHAAIHTEHSETADLVRAALDDLRSRLDADGVRSGQLTVDAHGAGTPGRDRQAPTPERLADGTTAVPEPTGATVPATTSDPDSLLDVRI
jgi:flagellar hook-length control protein FliK